MTLVTLSEQQLEALAVSLAEHLLAAHSTHERRLVDAAKLARMLDVSRDTVYRNAEALGVIRIGAGPGALLRFDPDAVFERWTHRSARERSAGRDVAAQAQKTRRRDAPALGNAGELLPVRGPSPTTARESS